MSMIGYILGGMFIAFLIVIMGRGAMSLKIVVSITALTYLAVAAYAPHLVPAVIVLNVISFLRVMFFDFLKTGGSSVSRHTERVGSKSFNSSWFTCLFVAAGFWICYGSDVALKTVMAWPLFFAVEYGWRRHLAYRTQKWLDKSRSGR